ncbi:hypothetical protein CEXT_582281 [Caerostris extrusa]|uniref:Uncharacterized protein n=1 Tax=Caerostris extrusa TaxID=172846 RepID=A0AAV4QVD5_CAEEX|nr:hypothetical protein CEXT_582281 [Caerostris extrusa]
MDFLHSFSIALKRLFEWTAYVADQLNDVTRFRKHRSRACEDKTNPRIRWSDSLSDAERVCRSREEFGDNESEGIVRGRKTRKTRGGI